MRYVAPSPRASASIMNGRVIFQRRLKRTRGRSLRPAVVTPSLPAAALDRRREPRAPPALRYSWGLPAAPEVRIGGQDKGDSSACPYFKTQERTTSSTKT